MGRSVAKKTNSALKKSLSETQAKGNASRANDKKRPKSRTGKNFSNKRRTAGGRSQPALVPEKPPREILLEAAKKLFARQGLSGTSIRDIAREANMNSSMISYYFEGKEGLYRACLQEIGESRLTFAHEILVSPATQEEFQIRLKMFATNMIRLFMEDRDTGLIVIREYDRLHSPAEDVFKKTFFKIYDLIVQFFQQAQENKVIPAHHDSFTMASLFFGCLSSQMRLDHLKDKTYGRTLRDPQEREKVLNHLVELFLH